MTAVNRVALRGDAARRDELRRVRADAAADSAGAADHPLWEGKAPGALGDAPEDIPTLTIYMPPNTTGPMTAVIVAPGGGYRALSMNKEGRIPANLSQLARHRGVRAEVPARTEISASDRAWRHAACDSHRSIACGRVAHRARPHRRHGIFGGRTSRVNSLHAVRSRQCAPRPMRSIARAAGPISRSSAIR